MRTKVFFIILFVTTVLLLNGNQLKAQSSISVGFGIPEYINVGYKWHKDQSGFSFAVGTLPEGDNFLISARAGYLYHFMGSRKHSEIKPWYINPGFAYNGIILDAATNNYFMTDLRIGREFSINPNWGVFTEIGLLYIFWKGNDMNTFDFTFDYKNQLYPSLNVGIYYRFHEGCNCPKIKTKP